MRTTKPLVIAHRGYKHIAPENTMLAFREARKIGADGIEMDVQMTKDNELVALHGARLDHTTNGTGLVTDYTLAELKQLDAGGWFYERTAGERIPTFREVCEFMAEWGALCNVHLGPMQLLSVRLERMVIRQIQEYGIGKQVILSSFDHEALKRCKEIDPDIQTAPLYSFEVLYRPWDYAKTLGASGLHPYFSNITLDMVSAAQAAGVAVRPWTVDTPGDLRRMIECGVEAIITNRPDTLLQILER